MYFPLELGDLWSSRSWVGLEVILTFSSLLQFCFGEQFPSVSLFPFVSFISRGETTLYYAMSQQKSFSKKIYLPFKQKCLRRWRGRKTSSSQLEGGWVAETPIPQEKVSASRCARGKRRTIPKRPLKNPPGYDAPFISATEKQKQQPLHPKGSLSITDSF